MDEVYEVARHDDDYYGPHNRRLAKSMETALDMAEEEREKHGGESWYMSTDVGGKEHLSFHCHGRSGWVTIRKSKVEE